MNAGVIKSKFKKNELDRLIKEYGESALPAIATHSGARGATLLVNRDTGDAVSIAFYENEAAAKAFETKAQQLAGGWSGFLAESTPSKRELYEVAVSTQTEAKATVEKDIKAFNAHDLEALARNAAPDVEATAPGGVKTKGPQAMKEFNKNFITAFPDARIEVMHMHVASRIVTVEAIFHGTHDGPLKTPMGDIPATGKKVRGEFVQVVEIDRGLVKRSNLIYDQVQLMTQLGMAPSMPQPATKTAR